MNQRFLWQQYAVDPNYCQRVAICSETETLTWQRLAERIEQFAFSFMQLGVKRGHCVALVGKNSVDLVLAYLAVLQLGGRVLGINPAFNAQKIRQICLDNEVYLCWSVEKNICFVDSKPNTDYCSLTMTLTSGSSGKPKAVLHQIEDHLANAQGVCQLVKFDAQSCWLLSLPLFHVSGQGILWRWLLKGARLQLAKQDFYATVAEVSHISFVPTQLQRWLDYLEQNPTICWQTQHILLGGSHIPNNVVQQAQAKGFDCYCGYGMTEMASTVFAKSYDHQIGVGQPLLGREYQLVQNEIWLRGAGLGLGYWQQGQVVSLLNQQGWLATKDKGRWDNNQLIIEGRLDNMFISGGENIQPEEIEQVLLRYSQLTQAIVLPITDKEFGQRPVAMIQFFQQYSESEVNKLEMWLSDKLEKFKQPIAYFPLPEQQNGIKFSRYELQQQLKILWNKC